MASGTAEKILNFWFKGLRINDLASPIPSECFGMWFSGKDKALDTFIRQEYMPIAETFFATNNLDGKVPDSAEVSCFLYLQELISCILLLDQFPRNAYRGLPESFKYDTKALKLALQFVDGCFDNDSINPVYRAFAYLVLLYSDFNSLLNIAKILNAKQDRFHYLANLVKRTKIIRYSLTCFIDIFNNVS